MVVVLVLVDDDDNVVVFVPFSLFRCVRCCAFVVLVQ